MPSADHGAPTVRPADVERWLGDLGLQPIERAERDGIASWDLVLDGRRRLDLRVTIILDPSLALICWAHFAPPISDMFRKSYRKLLRWNDDFPFAKFSVGEDEQPLLAVELPIDAVAPDDGSDALGLALTRIVGIADRVFDDTRPWLWIGGREPAGMAGRSRRNGPFLARFAPRLPELFTEADSGAEAGAEKAAGADETDAHADSDEPRR